MITADFVSGQLEWNSTITGPTTLGQMKSRGNLSKREKPTLNGKELKDMKKSPESQLDNLVSMMKDKEVVPKNLEFDAKTATGNGRVRSKAKAKPRAQGGRMSLDSIAAKYGVSLPAPRAPRAAAPRAPRASRAAKK